MLEKNQRYTAVITDLTFEGNGVCKIDGFLDTIDIFAKFSVTSNKGESMFNAHCQLFQSRLLANLSSPKIIAPNLVSQIP